MSARKLCLLLTILSFDRSRCHGAGQRQRTDTPAYRAKILYDSRFRLAGAVH